MEKEKEARKLTQQILNLIGFDGEIDVTSEASGKLCVNVSLKEAGILIGHGGENLRALQHILLLLVSRKTSLMFDPGSFVLDINNYQKEKENYLVALAKNTAQSVLQNRKPAELDPMPASDRRIIHLAIEKINGVKSESIGERSLRKVVVSLI